MASTSSSNKRVKGKETSGSSKRQCTTGNSNTIIIHGRRTTMDF
jgi:hypothetical protein